jgi:hypothetical protein
MQSRTRLPKLTGALARVFVPNDRTSSTGKALGTASRLTADGKRIFRMTPPLVIWWAWIALLIFSAADLLIQGHRLPSLKFALGGLALTGVVYTCTLWPKVIADDAGIRVRNPVRVINIPWGGVRGIFLADSVEIQCARPAGRKDKTVYCWALSSPRRGRARAQLRAWQWEQGKRSRPSGFTRLPDTARSLVKMTTAEIMARELAAMSDDARFKSVVQDVGLDAEDGRNGVGNASDSRDLSTSGDATNVDFGQDSVGRSAADNAPPELGGDGDYCVSSAWAWPPLVATLVPAAGFLVTVLVK